MVWQRKSSAVTAKARPRTRGRKTPEAGSQPENRRPVDIAPIVVEAGSRTRSSLRLLERGTGPLMHEIGQIVQAIHSAVRGPVSIVVVYRESRRGGSRPGSLFGLLPI